MFTMDIPFLIAVISVCLKHSKLARSRDFPQRPKMPLHNWNMCPCNITPLQHWQRPLHSAPTSLFLSRCRGKFLPPLPDCCHHKYRQVKPCASPIAPVSSLVRHHWLSRAHLRSMTVHHIHPDYV